MKKKIAIIIPGGIGGGYFSQGIPVLETYIQNVAEYFDVTVYSMIKTDQNYRPKNFTLRCTSASHTDSIFLKIYLISIIFIRHHVKDKYQLIHGIWGFPSGFLAVLFGKILQIPGIVSFQGGEAAYLPEIRYGNMLAPMKRKITLWTAKHASTLTLLTHFQLIQLQKFGFSRKDVHIIPYGSDNSLFAFQKKELSPPVHFIHIANLNEVKDQFTLLRAFKIISEKVDCMLRIIGDGENLDKLTNLCKELEIKDKVEFLGSILHRELPKQLEWAHIMLHTSLYEGQAVVSAEAAASGVVVCGTNVGLISDWGNIYCVSVPCKAYQMLSTEVINLIKDEKKYFALQKNAYKWAKANDTQAHLAAFQRLYLQYI